MSYTYTTYTAALAELMVTTTTDADFIAIEPSIIDYAEQRLYRELDLLATVTRDSAPLAANNRNFTFPTNNGRFVVANGINVITPSSQTVPDNGARHPLTATSRDALDLLWPSATGATVPTLFAPITDQTIIVGPWPDAGYTVEVIGFIRPAPLSATNTSTFLTLYLPDLFLAASMIFASGFQKNFGAQSDDPQMAQSWEGQYNKLFASANVEENRRKWAAGGWSSQQPTPLATPATR